MIIVGRSGRQGDWRDVAWILLPFGVALLVLDACTFARVWDFESHPPAAIETTARVRYSAPAHRRPGTLRVETPQGWVDLTIGPATVFGSPRIDIGSTQVTQDAPARVAWIDAPGGIFHPTLHYPLRVEQGGRSLRQVDGATGVAAALRADLLVEVLFVAFAMLVAPALALFVAHRRARARAATVSSRFRKRSAGSHSHPRT